MTALKGKCQSVKNGKNHDISFEERVERMMKYDKDTNRICIVLDDENDRCFDMDQDEVELFLLELLDLYRRQRR